MAPTAVEPRRQACAATALIRVELGQRSYPILIGERLLEQAGALIQQHAPAPRAAVISDETVAKLHGDRLQQSLQGAGLTSIPITVPAGEASKSFAMLERVVEGLLQAGIERGDLVVAFGGGVVGDLAGFAAAITRRGLRLVQIPTSLLAQVDSSVGGKTGINTAQGKNLAGAFHQPSLVIADISVLATLPQREMRAGYAEIVKYGLLGDAAFFAWLEENGPRVLAREAAALGEAVRVSCQAKAAIVAADEREAGQRALLNLGHTFAHALEAATGYSQTLLHGEAVAIGMCLAFRFSADLGLCPPEHAERAIAHLAQAGLATGLTDISGRLPDADGLIALMRQDKKVKDGKLTFILVRAIGEAYITQDITQDALRDFLARQLNG